MILLTWGVCLSECWDTPTGKADPLGKPNPPGKADLPQQGDPPAGKADPLPLARQTPRQRDPPPTGKADPPGKETPPHPPPPMTKQTPPCAVHAGRYGQQAGGMHPNGMQFLLTLNFLGYFVVMITLFIYLQQNTFIHIKHPITNINCSFQNFCLHMRIILEQTFCEID